MACSGTSFRINALATGVNQTMKKILCALLALFASAAFSATTVPVQLINPTGSSSGQAIVSTGASSAPAWGGIGVNGIAAIAANTVLANVTGSSASPTAFSMPSCSTSSSALNYTPGTGIGCNTSINAASLGGTAAASYALLASPAFTGTPTAPTASAGTNTTQIATTAFVTSSPTINTPTINGVTNGAVAGAGQVGQPITATGTNVALTSGTPTNVTSIILTAGDWDVFAGFAFAGASSAVSTVQSCGISTTSATFSGAGTYAGIGWSTSANGGFAGAVPTQVINVTTNTTVYLVAQANYSPGSVSVTGTITARRRH
jgi:hypothetical protein